MEKYFFVKNVSNQEIRLASTRSKPCLEAVNLISAIWPQKGEKVNGVLLTCVDFLHFNNCSSIKRVEEK